MTSQYTYRSVDLNETTNDFLLTVNEVAKCLKVSSQVVHKLARYGLLNKVKVGSLTRIERSELLRFIADGGGDFNG